MPCRVCAVAMLLIGRGNLEKNEVTPAEMPLKDGPSAMVPVPAGDFWMGANEDRLLLLEYLAPIHVDAFLMDVHEVTNAAFGEFVAATGYQTVAERPLNWDEFKQQSPRYSPAERGIFSPGSMVFTANPAIFNYIDYSCGGRGCWSGLASSVWT